MVDAISGIVVTTDVSSNKLMGVIASVTMVTVAISVSGGAIISFGIGIVIRAGAAVRLIPGEIIFNAISGGGSSSPSSSSFSFFC